MLLRQKRYDKNGGHFSNKMRKMRYAPSKVSNPTGVTIQDVIDSIVTRIAHNWRDETIHRSKMDDNALRFECIHDELLDPNPERGQYRALTLHRKYVLLPYESSIESFNQDNLPMIDLKVTYANHTWTQITFVVEEHWVQTSKVTIDEDVVLSPPRAVKTMPFLLTSLQQFSNNYKPK